LKDLYLTLKSNETDIDLRLSVLLRVKQTVKQFDCNLSREIIDLVDREGDLMTRGRSQHSLAGLRLRVLHLFYQFIRHPEFNPISRNYNNVP